MRVLCFVALLMLLAAHATSVRGDQALRLAVSPAVAIAPVLVTVRATVQAHDDNRALVVVAESADFYTSSEVPLNGRTAPALSVVEFRNVPPGLYDVSATLLGSRGPRAS